MSKTEVYSLADKLENTSLPKEGVSFAGQSLKLDTEAEAMVVVNSINECPNMEFLNLEGNTIGVDAADAIGKALKDKHKLKKLIWKDMFTGRLKNEIPPALVCLTQGLLESDAQLEVLDLSDNASGAIGIEGIDSLLRSPRAYTLKVLNLNNMGLGIGGAKLLADCLRGCLMNSRQEGTPFQLKVFIAGRNRLENEGITALADVFAEIGTLEEIQIPQNGIYYRGIRSLANALRKNPNLRILNLNDNTLNPQGAFKLSRALKKLPNLVKLDLGDCLIRTKGAEYIGLALNSHSKLEELNLSFNSIRIDGALDLLHCLGEMETLQKLNLDGNRFGPDGIAKVLDLAKEFGISSALESLSEDEGGSDDDSSTDDKDERNCDASSSEELNSSDMDEDYSEEEIDTSTASGGFINIKDDYSYEPKTEDVSDFLKNPTEKNFNKLGEDVTSLIIQHIEGVTESNSINTNKSNSPNKNQESSSVKELQDMFSSMIVSEPST